MTDVFCAATLIFLSVMTLGYQASRIVYELKRMNDREDKQ